MNMEMKNKKIFIVIFLAVFTTVALLYLDFANNTGRYRADNNKADAIVVLAGGRGRVDSGLELFEKKKGDYLIIVGADKGATLESIFFKKTVRLDKRKIILEKESASTYENAQETKKIIESMNIKSIILLTSFYHMKRASYLFSHELSPQTALYLYPVATPNFDEKAWWKGQGPVLLAVEFFKFYWHRVWI
ncbi:MAG: YdcF family protein [Deltaproteobacteria bacterium]|nr:YdcF family protein [Deltaproteobacteria bacterium]